MGILTNSQEFNLIGFKKFVEMLLLSNGFYEIKITLFDVRYFMGWEENEKLFLRDEDYYKGQFNCEKWSFFQRLFWLYHEIVYGDKYRFWQCISIKADFKSLIKALVFFVHSKLFNRMQRIHEIYKLKPKDIDFKLPFLNPWMIE